MTDTELYGLAAKGDDRAFAELAKRYETMVYNVAYEILGNREDAYDASQEALLRLWNSAKKYRGECEVKTWIYGITKNASLDIQRQRGRRQTVPLDDVPETAGHDTTEEAAMRRFNADAVRAAIKTLPLQYRETLLLRYMYDMDYTEIEKATGSPIGTVKSRLSRARELLAEALRENLEGHGTKRAPAPSKKVSEANER